MRRSKYSFCKMLQLVKELLKENPILTSKKIGRPKSYDDVFIISLWLFQTLHKFSYREILEYVSLEGYSVPALSTYHYRVQKLPKEVLQELIEKVGEIFFRRDGKRWKGLVVDGTGFGYREKYVLGWLRGTAAKEVASHVRAVLLVGIDEKKRIIPLSCEVDFAYASEVEMLRRLLSRVDKLFRLPFIGDKGFDAVDILERVRGLGCELAIKMKETWRVGIKHPLRKESKVGWERWGKEMRYLIEGVFGNIKLKLGSKFALIREDLALKRALAVFALYALNLIFFNLLYCLFLK